MIVLLRPGQWIKNLLVFMPVFFNGTFIQGVALAESAIVFCLFCIASSAVYCFNDMVDAPSDRNHPKKKLRPVASGAVSPKTAAAMGAILAVTSVAIAAAAFQAASLVAAIIASYLLLNIAYTLRLKHIPILDIMIVAFGFVLRVLAGGSACGIKLSPWIVILTFLATLFIAMAKRRADFIIQARTSGEQRRSVKGYSLPYTDVALGLLATMSVISYLMYSMQESVMLRTSEHFYVTGIFVLTGFMRYLMLAFNSGEGDNPSALLVHDKGILASVLAWIAACALFLYL